MNNTIAISKKQEKIAKKLPRATLALPLQLGLQRGRQPPRSTRGGGGEGGGGEGGGGEGGGGEGGGGEGGGGEGGGAKGRGEGGGQATTKFASAEFHSAPQRRAKRQKDHQHYLRRLKLKTQLTKKLKFKLSEEGNKRVKLRRHVKKNWNAENRNAKRLKFKPLGAKNTENQSK